MGSISGLGRSPGEDIPTPVFWLGEFHGQRSLVGSNPWGRKESDMTEHTQTDHAHDSIESTQFIWDSLSISGFWELGIVGEGRIFSCLLQSLKTVFLMNLCMQSKSPCKALNK